MSIENTLTRNDMLNLIGSAIKEPEMFDRFDGESVVSMMSDFSSDELELDFNEKNEIENALQHFYS